MENKSKRILWILLGLIIILGILFIFKINPLTGNVTKNEPIKIGAPLILTGKLASFGEDTRKGIDLAVQEINSHGGINGKQIEIIYEDTKGEVSTAVTSVNKLINVDEVKIIIGPIGSGELLSIAPNTEKEKIILFTPIAGSDEIANAGDFVFRNRESSGLHAKKMAAYFLGKDIHSCAVITANAANAVSYSKVFEKTYSEIGGDIVYTSKYDPEQKDFKTEIEKIKDSGAESIYISPASGVDGAIIVNQLRTLGFKGYIGEHLQ
jgi:branched-chain amino acid transport system substrate-binding protein